MATDAARLGNASAGEQPVNRAIENLDEPPIRRAWQERAGLGGWISTASSVRNGLRLIIVAFLFLVLGGLNAALMRIQLAQPNSNFLTPEQYNQLFTMHGSTMLFLFAMPFMFGGAMMLLPLLLGARSVPWPRLTNFIFWTFLIGGVLFEASWLVGTPPDAGWTSYVPLSGKAFSPNQGIDFWLIGLSMIAIGGVLASALLIVTSLKSRAPGMSLGRMPLFAWAILTMAGVMFVSLIVLLYAAALLESDRKFGTHFYDTGRGGPLVWQYLFWFFGRPAIYVYLLPAAGITSTILPVLVRQRTIGYRLLAAALVLIGFLSLGLWGDPSTVATLGPLGVIVFTIASLLVALLSAIVISAWLATIWRGSGKWNTAYLFILGFIFLFLIGLLTQVMLALYPFNAQVQGSMFVVAHLHYILLGTVVLPVFAGFYYWFPKFTGRLMDERLGKWNFWLMFLGMNVAFFPMFISGLLGMPRRVYSYPASPELATLNLISTIGAVILVTGILVFLWNLIGTLMSGQLAPANPWQADSLEWATPSPLPEYGFRQIPMVAGPHPLWNQERLDAGDEKTTALVNRLAEWPNTWRAALATSARTGEPEGVYRVAGPSASPLFAAIGIALILLSLLFDQLAMLALLLAGIIVLVISLMGWHRRAADEISISQAELDDFDKAFGVPIHPHGNPAINRWAVLLAILGLLVAVAAGVFPYLVF